ncbi:response regulator transcription factor [Arcobacter roscoffensis]|uniref:Response regulator transcription factor n=1 Tax=Arcobacter roscoffensis TaxID=2961520 RepID=A0ABY5E5Z8_9BACT|nr:response regulator transcription factor [Arcobacter roscoffensis]UTJ06924.1 response regulator transcription factor [Arcobacter roscoffensis]
MSINNDLELIKTLNILYIEDEKEIRENISKVLSMFSKSVITGKNGTEALEIYKKNKIDIIISDINMPELSGIELIKIIREENKYIPVILLTSHTETNLLLDATKLKLTDYLLKPINLTDLKNALFKATEEYLQHNGIIANFPNNIKYDITKKQLFGNGDRKDITNKEILLLEYLYENKNRTVTKEEIKVHLWEDEFEATEGAFKSVLTKLRKKIGKESILNISGIGYQLKCF